MNMFLLRLLSTTTLALLFGGRVRAMTLSSGYDAEFECIRVPQNVSMCYGVLHATTKLPNWAGDETLNELISTSNSWKPLLTTSNPCHPDAKQFLCSVFTPICLQPSGLSRAVEVPPCRSFCAAVRQGCEPFLEQMGIPWPLDFRCSRFPQGLCFSPNITVDGRESAVTESKKCEFCGTKMLKAALVRQYCVSSMVLVGRVEKNGMVVPRGKNLSVKSVLYGMPLAQRTVQRAAGGKVFFNVTDACTCTSANLKARRTKGISARRERDGERTVARVASEEANANRGFSLVFVDHTLSGELVASMIVSLDTLTREQTKDFKTIRSDSPVTCDPTAVRKTKSNGGAAGAGAGNGSRSNGRKARSDRSGVNGRDGNQKKTDGEKRIAATVTTTTTATTTTVTTTAASKASRRGKLKTTTTKTTRSRTA